MKKSYFSKRFFAVFLCLSILCFFTACGSASSESAPLAGGTASSGDQTSIAGSSENAMAGEMPALSCPFTDMDWSCTVDALLTAEGEDYDSYDSVYGGLCYTYPKEYEGHMGTIKYMFNEKDELKCVAWAYDGTSDEEGLLSLYDTINDHVNGIYGESGYESNGVNNYGNVWYLESGDIVLTTMLTSDNKALQYAYLHPSVSKKE